MGLSRNIRKRSSIVRLQLTWRGFERSLFFLFFNHIGQSSHSLEILPDLPISRHHDFVAFTTFVVEIFYHKRNKEHKVFKVFRLLSFLCRHAVENDPFSMFKFNGQGDILRFK